MQAMERACIYAHTFYVALESLVSLAPGSSICSAHGQSALQKALASSVTWGKGLKQRAEAGLEIFCCDSSDLLFLWTTL